MNEQDQKSRYLLMRPWILWLVGVLLIVSLVFLSAWVTSGYTSVQHWWSFILVGILASLSLVGGWLAIKSDHGLPSPNWVFWILVGAVVIRIAAGIFWYSVLPVIGHGTPAELDGYVMGDAHERDHAAWEFAQSDQPLLDVIRKHQRADQYGGMLFVSAIVYRYLGGETHAPLLMIVLTATISALTVLFTWAFAYRMWDRRVAVVAAVIVALYPEAILMGSSQMREAFTMTLAMMALYGLVRYFQDRSRLGFGLILLGLVFCVLISPPFLALLIIVLVVVALYLGNWGLVRRRWFWLAVIGLLILAGAALWLTWGNIAPEGVSNPVALIGWWLRKSSDWQAYLSERSSGWIQKVFRSTPEWMHSPFLIIYGVVQPFLPAALISSGIPIWKGIAIWRALGWTFLLGFLLFVPMHALREGRKHKFILLLSLIAWLMILIASFRGGGDAWDNPRYRVAFLGIQVILVAWVLVENWKKTDPWLIRALIAFGIVMAWFVPWYLRRYTPLNWPVEDLFITIGLGLVSAGLYIIWDILRLRKT
jgi:hypothetical protein